jgi:glycosyltransferase involved in cell wall biosynthesis
VYVLIPGDLETRTGGYGYDRRIIAGLRDRGWTVNLISLDGSFPLPTPAARAGAAKALAAIPDGALVLADGLALGALPDEAAHQGARLNIIALVHHPLAGETGLDPETAAALEVSERRALAAVRRVVVTSRATAAALSRYGVTADRITVIEPGTDPAPLSGRAPFAINHEPSAISHQPSEVRLLCVATLTPRKGYEILIEALAAVPSRNWRLACAGSVDRDAATVTRVRGLIREHSLEDRVSLIGDLDAESLAAEYDRADLFVLPTFYEGYGMAVAEALAHGVPVVSTATGAIPDLVGDAGMVVPPGDAGAFTSALTRVLGDPELRARLTASAATARDRLPTWPRAAAAMDEVLARARRRADAPSGS